MTDKKYEWNSLYCADAPAALDPVAEPMHRVGPDGVSSGVSFRDLPEPCFEQVKKVCKHYVQKCSGKYELNKMAARYVHQLAGEVLSMLSGIANELQTHQEISKIAKHRFEEWDKNFPPILREIGGPDDIANFLKEKEAENRQLRAELAAERRTKSIDLENVMRSMDYQLHASRNGALNERQQLTQEFQALVGQLSNELHQSEAKLRLEIANLHDHYNSHINDINKKHENATLQLTQQHAEQLRATDNEKNRIAANAEQEIAQMAEHRDEMRAKIIKLQKQVHPQPGGNDSDSDVSSDGGSLTLTSTAVSGSAEAIKAETKRKLSKKYRKKITKLSRKLESSRDVVVHKNIEIESLCRQLEDLAAEIKSCHKKLTYQREINEHLRLHLEERMEARHN